GRGWAAWDDGGTPRGRAPSSSAACRTWARLRVTSADSAVPPAPPRMGGRPCEGSEADITQLINLAAIWWVTGAVDHQATRKKERFRAHLLVTRVPRSTSIAKVLSCYVPAVDPCGTATASAGRATTMIPCRSGTVGSPGRRNTRAATG